MPDAKIYLAKCARRAFQSGNVEFAAVLHSCPTTGQVENKVVVGDESVMPQEVQELLDAFLGVFAELTSLPPRRMLIMQLLLPGQKPPVRPPYPLPQAESLVLQNQVDELLAKGLIEPSVNPFAPFVLVVKHKNMYRLHRLGRNHNEEPVSNAQIGEDSGWLVRLGGIF